MGTSRRRVTAAQVQQVDLDRGQPAMTSVSPTVDDETVVEFSRRSNGERRIRPCDEYEDHRVVEAAHYGVRARLDRLTLI